MRPPRPSPVSFPLVFVLLLLGSVGAESQQRRGGGPAPLPEPTRTAVEIARFPAREANQAVAVDADHFYAITNTAIGKYNKRTGEKMDEWVEADGGPIIHLNSGIILDGMLYTAHSNFPYYPMQSSVEVWDPETMDHVASHSLGLLPGSLTWLDRRDGLWYAAFVNYVGHGSDPARSPEHSYIGVFDAEWRQVGGYAFPYHMMVSFLPQSASGGTFGPDGFLYLSPHTPAELHVARLPSRGSVLEPVEVIPLTNQGQGIAWDPSQEGVLWGIHRQNREVISWRVDGLVTEDGGR